MTCKKSFAWCHDMDFKSFMTILWKQNPSGEKGFEGLIRKLLENLVDHPFHLSSSGRQEGRDMASSIGRGNYIVAECKRYDNATRLSSDELLIKLLRAANSIQPPDIFLVVTTKRLSEQHDRDLKISGEERGITCIMIDAKGNESSTLLALCASEPNIVAVHISGVIQDIGGDESDEIVLYLQRLSKREATQRNITFLRNTLLHDALGYELWSAKQNEWLVSKLRSVQESKAVFHQDFAVRSSSNTAVTRKNATKALTEWGRVHIML